MASTYCACGYTWSRSRLGDEKCPRCLTTTSGSSTRIAALEKERDDWLRAARVGAGLIKSDGLEIDIGVNPAEAERRAYEIQAERDRLRELVREAMLYVSFASGNAPSGDMTFACEDWLVKAEAEEGK